MSTTPITDPTICVLIKSKRLSHIPMVRFNPISPYSNPITGVSTNVTAEQLNMRRKAEILKYSSNRMPNQTNNLTKKQQWAQLVTKPAPRTAPTNNADQINCGINIPVSSSASDVPGPSIMLYEDPNVPLYNFIINRAYAFDVPNETDFWKTTVNTNVGLYSDVAGDAFTLNILSGINQPQYTYTVRIPIGIHAEGIVPTNLQSELLTDTTLGVVLNTVSLIVYCNGTDITQQLPRNPTLNKILNSKLTVNIPYGQQSKFNVTQVVDTVSFSGITLYTSAVYTFTFAVKLNFNTYINNNPIDTTSPQQSVFNHNMFVYANITDDIPIIAENCRVVEPDPIVLLTTPSIFT